MPANTYSSQWFSLFLHQITPEQTAREVEFVDQWLERRSRVLDVPCGSGRHALGLAERQHRIIAVDRRADLLGSSRCGSISWICGDMRALPLAPGRLDAIICLWQSFGYFGGAENAAVLRHWAELVRPGGCLVLDLYHREFFELHQGESQIEHSGGRIHQRKLMKGDRLIVDLTYPDGTTDRFNWQLFAPEELKQLALGCGWEMQHACSSFDAAAAPDPQRPRVQYVLRRYGRG